MQSLSQFLASDASSASLQEVLLVTTQTCIEISSALKKRFASRHPRNGW